MFHKCGEEQNRLALQLTPPVISGRHEVTESEIKHQKSNQIC